jgi:hypothetical protein
MPVHKLHFYQRQSGNRLELHSSSMEQTATSRVHPQPAEGATSPMPEQATASHGRLLHPVDRISEVLFGLIMVLTVTCSLSVGTAGPGATREILIGALGCNLAWGIIDAFIYLLAQFSEQGQSILALRGVHQARHPEEAHRIIAGVLPPVLARVLLPEELETMRQQLNRLPEPPDRPRLKREDWLGALGVFLLVFLSTLPVLIPFVVMGTSKLTIRVSNGIAILMLFVCGYAFGRHVAFRPRYLGSAMVVFGLSLVGIAMVLGG